MLVALSFLIPVATYAVIGLVFAMVFVTRGVDRLDRAARGAGWGFRLFILPGSVALWPWLAMKWRRVFDGEGNR